MGQGLECWDAQGRLIFGTGDSISKIIGTITTQQNVAGSITVAELAGPSRLFVVKRALPPSGPFPNQIKRSEITISGRVINWTAGRGPMEFSYGVY